MIQCNHQICFFLAFSFPFCLRCKGHCKCTSNAAYHGWWTKSIGRPRSPVLRCSRSFAYVYGITYAAHPTFYRSIYSFTRFSSNQKSAPFYRLDPWATYHQSTWGNWNLSCISFCCAVLTCSIASIWMNQDVWMIHIKYNVMINEGIFPLFKYPWCGEKTEQKRSADECETGEKSRGQKIYAGLWVCVLRFGTNKDVIGSFFADVRDLGGDRRLSGAGEDAGTTGIAMGTLPGNREVDFSAAVRDATEEVLVGAEVDGAVTDCGRWTVIVFTEMRLEEETANGGAEPENGAIGGEIRNCCWVVGNEGRIRAFRARWIFDASHRVFWNSVLGCEIVFPVRNKDAWVIVWKGMGNGNNLQPPLRGRLAGGTRSVSLTSFSFFLSSASWRWVRIFDPISSIRFASSSCNIWDRSLPMNWCDKKKRE